MIVVDTNLILALAVNTDVSPLAFSIYQKDNEWVAPPIWESEMRNALLAHMRAGQIGLRAATEAHALAAQSVQTLPVATAAVLRIADAHGLTAYDAEFVALAEWVGCPAISFDADLTQAGLAIKPEDF